MNISAYRTSGSEYTFDSLRYQGDVAFACAMDSFGKWVEEYEQFIDRCPQRVVDFIAARQWIEDHDCTKERLLKLVNDMEADTDLVVEFCW